jgi:pyridoxine 4-dehydrogenase
MDAQQALTWSLSADERTQLDQSSAEVMVRMPDNPFQSA